MVLYSIGVYIINRTLHSRLDIRNFSSRVENISTLEEKFRISARPCNILYVPILASNIKFLPYIEEASKSKKHDCYPKPVQHIFGLF